MIQPAKKQKTGGKSAAQKADAAQAPALPVAAQSVSLKVRPHSGGKPAHKPTQISRNAVSLALVCGFTHAETARMMGIALSTLQKHYAEELEDGGKKLTLAVAGNLAKIAMDPNHPKAVTAAIFWLKTKGGFREEGAPADPDNSGDKVTFTINIGGSGPPLMTPKIINA